MILLFKLIIITTIWVLGVKISTAEEMILEKLGKYGEKKVEAGHKIYDALWVCPWCMSSIHSLVGYGFAFLLGLIPFEWNWQLVYRYPLIVMGTSIAAGMTWTIYLTINQIKDKNEIEWKYYSHVEQLKYFELKEKKKKYQNSNHD